MYPFSVYGSTTAGCDALFVWSQKHTSLLRAWFRPALWVAVPCALLSLGILASNLCLAVSHLPRWWLIDSLHADSLRSEESALSLSITGPGVNIPWDMVGYLWLAISLSVIVHEGGHALAAAAFGVRTRRVGFFFLGFFPGAFVELEEHAGARVLNPLHKLKIALAGIWHNVALCLLCLVVLGSLRLCTALLFSHVHPGVTVTAVDPHHVLSPLISAGRRLSSVDGAPVSSPDAWMHALHSVASTSQQGYCFSPAELLLMSQVSSSEGPHCCNRSSSSALTCLYAHRAHVDSAAAAVPTTTAAAFTPGSGVPAPAPSSTARVAASSNAVVFEPSAAPGWAPAPASAWCVSARRYLLPSRARARCRSDDDCALSVPAPAPSVPHRHASGTVAAPSETGRDSNGAVRSCLRPLLSEGERVLALGLGEPSAATYEELLYAGGVADLASAVTVSRYALGDHATRALLVAVAWAEMCETALLFVIVISASLALLNSAPVVFADGSLAVTHLLAVLDTVETRHYSSAAPVRSASSSYARPATCLVRCTTALLGANVLCSLFFLYQGL